MSFRLKKIFLDKLITNYKEKFLRNIKKIKYLINKIFKIVLKNEVSQNINLRQGKAFKKVYFRQAKVIINLKLIIFP